MKEIISRGDLHYDRTVDVSDEGMPVGNGTMASLIWTSPWSLKLQINRCDVYASNSASTSFNHRNEDYSYGCASVDISLDTGGPEVFPKTATTQHLSIYEGVITIEGAGVRIRIVASQKRDVFAIEIKDNREASGPVKVALRMLRASEVYQKHHSAISRCISQSEAIALKQEFSEGDYFCSSAVASVATGGSVYTRLYTETGGPPVVGSSAKIPGIGLSMETEVILTVNPESPSDPGSQVIYLSSAASFDPSVDTVSNAVAIAQESAESGFDTIAAETGEWFSRFWSGEYVSLASADGAAAIVEAHYTYFLYLLACTSRGKYAPRYGGMLFSTHGDRRAWGAQQWWTNLSLYYRGIFPTGKFELLNGCCNFYLNARESCAVAASQQWGSSGIYFPETMWFDGLDRLPDDIAKEMRELYLCQKPWSSRSADFDAFASARHPHSSRWNWIGHGTWVDGIWTYGDNAVPPFSPVNHFFASGGEIAMVFWKRYEYSGDIDWLRDAAYPVLKGVAEFLSGFPNFRLEGDGLYHVTKVNQGEHLHGARDTVDFLCAVKGVLPIAARAATTLGVDEDLRNEWQEIAARTAPLPTTRDPDSVEAGVPGEPERLTDARKPVVDGKPRPGIEEFNSRFYDFDLGNLESRENGDGLLTIADNTFSYKYPDGVGRDTPVRVMSSLPVIAAKLGRTEDFRHAVVNIIKVLDPARDFCDYEGQGCRGALANRMTNREGVNSIGAQRLGTVVYAVNEALCQSDPPTPGGRPVIRLFPAWPAEWDAAFCLRVRGGNTVSAKIEGGQIPEVIISPVDENADREVLVRNPWPESKVALESPDGTVTMDGELLTVPIDSSAGVRLYPSHNP